MTPQVVHVSPHLLADVVSCKTKAWTRHVKGFTSKGDAIKAVAGQAIHAGVASYLNPQPLNDEANRKMLALQDMHAVYDPAWARLAADQLEPSLVPTNLHRLLDRWIEMHPQHLLPWTKVLSVEEAFCSREWKVPLIDGMVNNRPNVVQFVTVKLIVRPDAVVEDTSGFIRYLDTKTTGWRISDSGWRTELRMSTQTALYADAVRCKYGEKAALGGWINAMELRQLPGSQDTAPRLKKDGTPMAPRKCAEHGVPYTSCGNEHAKSELIECMTTEESIAQALADAEAAAGDFVRMLVQEPRLSPDSLQLIMPQEGRANRTCRFCAANSWCDTGRYIASMDSLMVYEPWPIEEGHRT